MCDKHGWGKWVSSESEVQVLRDLLIFSSFYFFTFIITIVLQALIDPLAVVATTRYAFDRLDSAHRLGV